MVTKRIIIVMMSVIMISMPCLSQTGEELHTQDKADSTIQKITIKHSGFLKDDVLIIEFRKGDHEITKVIDEDKVISEDNFYKYETMLHNYLQFRSLEDIVPRVSRLKREIRRNVARLDRARIRDLVRLQLRVDSLDMGIVFPKERIAQQLLESIRLTKKDMADIRARVQVKKTEIEEQIRKLLEELNDEGIIPYKEDITIKTKKGKCWVNGRRLSDEDTEKLEEIWNKHMEHPFDKSGRIYEL